MEPILRKLLTELVVAKQMKIAHDRASPRANAPRVIAKRLQTLAEIAALQDALANRTPTR